MYQSLDPGKIVATAEALGRRVHERFPDSGLGKVIGELIEVVHQRRRYVGRDHCIEIRRHRCLPHNSVRDRSGLCQNRRRLGY